MANKNKTFSEIFKENDGILNSLNDNTPISADDLHKLRENNQSLKSSLNGMEWFINILLGVLVILLFSAAYWMYQENKSLEDSLERKYVIADSLKQNIDSIRITSDSTVYKVLSDYADSHNKTSKDYIESLNENYKLKLEIFDLKDSLQDFKIFNEIAKDNYKLKYIKVNKGKTVSYSVESDYFNNKNKKSTKIIDQKQNDTIVK